MFENMELRAVLCRALEELMEQDERIMMIDSDLAKANGTISLREKFQGRALDVGIAEQNMAGVAAGLASYGFIPFIASFTPFSTRRICDQIAISIAYAKMNVKIIGTDPGISAELNGGTHMSFEDIGVLRSIPGLVIYDAADATELYHAIKAAAKYDGPVYIRCYRKTLPAVYDENIEFDLLKGDIIKEGTDVSIFTSGIMVKHAIDACDILKDKGYSAEVINLHTIKPVDKDLILNSVKKTKCAVTCDNHNIIGGLFSAVCEVTSFAFPVPVVPIGIMDHIGEVGKMQFLLEKFKMTPNDIANACIESINKKLQ